MDNNKNTVVTFLIQLLQVLADEGAAKGVDIAECLKLFDDATGNHVDSSANKVMKAYCALS